MPSKSEMLFILGVAVTVFLVPAVRGYFVLTQPKNVLLHAEAGFTLNETDVYLTMNDTTECGCRRVCEMLVQCKHSAFDSTTNECLLTANPKPWLVVQPGATFLRRIKPASDGLYYIVNSRELFTYDDCVAICAGLGFRIAQAKNKANLLAMMEQFEEDAESWARYAFVGLKHDAATGTYTWQDGTSVDMSMFRPNEPKLKPHGSGSNRFTIAPSKITESYAGENHGYLCQANFNYLDW